MDKPAAFAYMLDMYGPLLSERQRQLAEMKLNEDLSYTEIAENVGISRQGAHDAVQKAVKNLETYERMLGFIAYKASIREDALGAIKALSAGDAVEGIRLLMRMADVQ